MARKILVATVLAKGSASKLQSEAINSRGIKCL
jgi:hypothetical protein